MSNKKVTNALGCDSENRHTVKTGPLDPRTPGPLGPLTP